MNQQPSAARSNARKEVSSARDKGLRVGSIEKSDFVFGTSLQAVSE